jgi:YD repeat-containing protein
VWRIFSVTFDEGKTFRLSAIDDRNKNRIALAYEDGKLAEVKDSAGRVIKVASTKEGHISSLHVKNAEHQGQWIRFAHYDYDDKGRLVRVTDADGYAWTYAYDEFNRLVRDTDRVGLSFCFRYDAQDRGIEAWGEYIGKKDPSLADDVPQFLYDRTTRAKGIYHRKLDYHARGYTEVTDTTETRRYFGNARGTLDKAVSGGVVTSSRYDERGFEIEKTDPLGETTRWSRDERGRMVEVVDPLGRRITITRDPHGLPVEVIDAAGGVTRAHRDGRGNLQVAVDPMGATIQLVADVRGLITSITAAGGATSRYTYDTHGNVVEVIQANGGRWVFAYDAFGRRSSARDPAGFESRYTYSDRGDLLAMYGPASDVTRYGYDGEQHVTQVVGSRGQTQFEWGGSHKLCARRDANGHLVRLAYDREGQLVAVTNERDEVQRLSYDAAGRLVRDETFDGRDLRYGYDLAGRVVRVENGAHEVTELTYDAVGQIVSRTLPDGTSEAFDFDVHGRVVRAANPVGEFRLERDAVGRVVREAQKIGSCRPACAAVLRSRPGARALRPILPRGGTPMPRTWTPSAKTSGCSCRPWA